jgi:DNA-binding transcriptional MerR regulator
LSEVSRIQVADGQQRQAGDQANDRETAHGWLGAYVLGFTLDKVRQLLELAAPGGEACAQVRTLAAAHLTDVRVRIADLRSIL